MELFPALKLGWRNGWILLVLFYAVFGLLILIFPRSVVKRLYDKSGWSRWQRLMALVIKLVALILMFLLLMTPLTASTGALTVGLIIYALGFALMVAALIAFRQTPLGESVQKGVYRISRNPQWVALILVMVGNTIAIGSWIALILGLLASAAGHVRILAEEQSCLAQYGDSYRAYMARVPRYFLIV